MFTCKVNPFTFNSVSIAKISETYEAPRTSRPLIIEPTLVRTSFEVGSQTGKNFIQLRECRRNSFTFFHTGYLLSNSCSRVSHQQASRARLTPGGLPNLDVVARERKTV
jgi:hypothetical protein